MLNVAKYNLELRLILVMYILGNYMHITYIANINYRRYQLIL